MSCISNHTSRQQIEATLVATTLDLLRLLGLGTEQIKLLFAADVIDVWFAIKSQ